MICKRPKFWRTWRRVFCGHDFCFGCFIEETVILFYRVMWLAKQANFTGIVFRRKCAPRWSAMRWRSIT